MKVKKTSKIRMSTEEAERPVLLSARTTINDSFQMFRGKNQAQHHLGFQLYDLYVIYTILCKY